MVTFDEWLAQGIEKGFCTESFCSTHDVAPMTQTEADEFDEGGDPCVHVVRLGDTSDWLN